MDEIAENQRLKENPCRKFILSDNSDNYSSNDDESSVLIIDESFESEKGHYSSSDDSKTDISLPDIGKPDIDVKNDSSHRLAVPLNTDHEMPTLRLKLLDDLCDIENSADRSECDQLGNINSLPSTSLKLLDDLCDIENSADRSECDQLGNINSLPSTSNSTEYYPSEESIMIMKDEIKEEEIVVDENIFSEFVNDPTYEIENYSDSVYHLASTHMIDNDDDFEEPDFMEVDVVFKNIDDDEPIIPSLFHLKDVIDSTANTLAFFRNYGLLRNNNWCKRCRRSMKIRKMRQTSDGEVFYCPRCKTTATVRQGSMFEKSKQSLDKILTLLYMWSVGTPAFVANRLFGTDVSDHFVHEWYQTCRAITLKHLSRHPVKFSSGLLNLSVYKCETIFGFKRKTANHDVNVHFHDKLWLVLLVEPITNKVHLEMIKSPTPENLEKLIDDHIDHQRETYVRTDPWRLMQVPIRSKKSSNRTENGKTTKNTEKSNDYLELCGGKKDGSVEKIWGQFKSWVTRMNGIHGKSRDLYIAEFMFRNNFPSSSLKNCINQLVKDISELYKV